MMGSKKLISVITATARENSLELAVKSLKKQTLKDFEWLIVSPIADKFLPGLRQHQSYRIKQHDPFPIVVMWDPPKPNRCFWTLNQAYNHAIRFSHGELIVFLQDSIMISPTGLEQFWEGYKKTKACITGVGDQYECIDEMGKPSVKVWSDPRRRLDQGSFYECMPIDFEINWGCAPKQALYDIGGFDEELDRLGYGGDNVSICERLDTIGIKFYIDQSCESFTVRHNRSIYGGENEWNKNHVIFSGAYKKRKRELIQSGSWPVLDFLEQA